MEKYSTKLMHTSRLYAIINNYMTQLHYMLLVRPAGHNYMLYNSLELQDN